jgi:AcrR family transcriptional regulator
MQERIKPLRERNKDLARETVLDAAERLLEREGAADFSMRALAAEAGVGFATPFNHFGSKNAIMQALSARLIARMAARFSERRLRGVAPARVLAMGRIAVAVLLEHASISKVVVGSLGVVDSGSPAVHRQSSALWSTALGDFAGIASDTAASARALLPEQLAFLFRGGVSFWIAGELPDEHLGVAFESSASAVLLGYVEPKLRPPLLNRLISLGRKRTARVPVEGG